MGVRVTFGSTSRTERLRKGEYCGRFTRQIIEVVSSTPPPNALPPPWTNYLLLNFDCASGGRPAVLAAAPILSAAAPLPTAQWRLHLRRLADRLLRLRRATLIHPHPRG
jgi:hypothetical protein